MHLSLMVGVETPNLDDYGSNILKGAFAVGKISDEERFDVVRHACPGAGACGGMYTANTMSSALEVGMFLRETKPGLAICRFLACPCLIPQAPLLRILVRKFIPFLVLYVNAAFLENRKGPRMCEGCRISQETPRIGPQAKVCDAEPFLMHEGTLTSIFRDILTRNSFLNAIVIITVLGGSTNAVRCWVHTS